MGQEGSRGFKSINKTSTTCGNIHGKGITGPEFILHNTSCGRASMIIRRSSTKDDHVHGEGRFGYGFLLSPLLGDDHS
ncbi:hypothetical protein Holit_03405 [Hollandina sp. SP2]